MKNPLLLPTSCKIKERHLETGTENWKFCRGAVLLSCFVYLLFSSCSVGQWRGQIILTPVNHTSQKHLFGHLLVVATILLPLHFVCPTMFISMCFHYSNLGRWHLTLQIVSTSKEDISGTADFSQKFHMF